ncbi:MAG: response regulator transcription factor [Nocardioides sp.]
MSENPSPVRVAIVNDYELVVSGVAAVLEPYRDRVQVLELDSRMPVLNDVDVVLYDTFGQVQGDVMELEELTADSDARVVVFTWNTDPALVRRAVAHGAAGYVSKSLGAAEMVEAIERVHAGEVVVPADDVQGVDGEAFGRWPGDEEGLSARESEMVALVVQGHSNQEIAERTYLSINSVKTYIRTAYRKIGVTTRSQAVVWGMQHGFEPDRSRIVRPGARD